MMNLRLGFGAAALLVTACSTGSGGPRPEAQVPPTMGSLSVLVRQAGPTLSVQLDRRASVAVFEILPTVGVGMLFPGGPDEDTWLEQGNQTLRNDTRIIRRHRDAYQANAAGGALGGARSSAVREATRATIVAVACVCDLSLSEIVRPAGPRRIAGPFPGLDENTAVNRILAEILPPQGAAWAIHKISGSLPVR